jgi:signal transduction histidine kinase
MKKVGLVFVIAVFVPSLVLAWLAVRSLRDQRFVLERQQSLLFQGVTDSLAKQAADSLDLRQSRFAGMVEDLYSQDPPGTVTKTFDTRLRAKWPVVEVGFVVTLSGSIVCPSPASGPQAQAFCDNNGRFLSCRESAEVYLNTGKQGNNTFAPNSVNSSQTLLNQPNAPVADVSLDKPGQKAGPSANSSLAQSAQNSYFDKRSFPTKAAQPRNVSPQQQMEMPQGKAAQEQNPAFSKIASSEAEFCQLIGEANEGTLARFVENKLNVWFWCRYPRNGQLVFGAQLALAELGRELSGLVDQIEPALRSDICIALLDDAAKPVALSQPGFHANWKRPFVASEIGESLPHWEMAVYLLDPAKLTRSARTLKLTLGVLIGFLVLAIGIGSWLIVTDLKRQLTLARQKTDFVSNVSHELKTPLTSIRMFSELLAEGRISDKAKQRSYLGIITAETARLTRLINNVLDFARLERGEKKYNFQSCDLAGMVRETAETYRPHLEANGFQFECHLPETPLMVNGDRDALAQIVVNLLSNAEKYSDTRKEIVLQVEQQTAPLPYAEVKVLDRGLGVPGGCEAKIFEQFYRAHDSLSSGIQGSGLGLTLARQIARAHGGDIACQPRDGGGSCFILRLPLKPV